MNDFLTCLSAKWEKDKNRVVSLGRLDDAYELGFVAAWQARALSAPVVPVIEGLEEALASGQMSKKMAWDVASAYADLPKLQKVDLDGMKRGYAGLDDYNHSAKAHVDGFNRAIDDIKSKYGELYAEVKE